MIIGKQTKILNFLELMQSIFFQIHLEYSTRPYESLLCDHKDSVVKLLIICV